MVKRWIFLALLAASLSVHAETLQGTVVAIADGDTLTVLDTSRQQHTVRLAGVDAPERNQPFGEKSRTNLARLALNQEAIVEWSRTDATGQLIGKLLVAGQDAGLQQLKEGMAWWRSQYVSDQPAQDRAAYGLAESQARLYRFGLWNDKNPMPPWNWRHATGQ